MKIEFTRPMQDEINELKAKMPNSSHNDYYILEDLLFAMEEQMCSYGSDMKRKKYQEGLIPMNRFFKYRDQFIDTLRNNLKINA
tara:strand:+ start:46 stop:297 length:252 start_codon:yes stop_codon:yes gene_type:complete